MQGEVSHDERKLKDAEAIVYVLRTSLNWRRMFKDAQQKKIINSIHVCPPYLKKWKNWKFFAENIIRSKWREKESIPFKCIRFVVSFFYAGLCVIASNLSLSEPGTLSWYCLLTHNAHYENVCVFRLTLKKQKENRATQKSPCRILSIAPLEKQQSKLISLVIHYRWSAFVCRAGAYALF